MHFTSQQIDQYHELGYLTGPRVLTDEQIEELRARITDILEGRIDFPEHLMGQTVDQSAAKGQLPSVKIVNIFRRDEVFAKVVHNEAIGSLANDLMEGPVRMWEDQMIYKPPFDEKAYLGWHRDYTYWNHVGPGEMGTCWIALDDATVDNGCMYMVPGSHRWQLKYNRDDVDPTDPHWLLKLPDIPKDADTTPVPRPVKAGHCHFHHCKTFHGSYGNKTDKQRRGYVMHLMPGNTRRLGSHWNDRQSNAVDQVPIGDIVQGPDYPELTAAAL